MSTTTTRVALALCVAAAAAVLAGPWSCGDRAASPLAPGDVPLRSAQPPPAGDGLPLPSGGIWISREELSRRPEQGPAWAGLVSAAHRPCGIPDLGDQDDKANVCVLAKALVYARTGEDGLRREVSEALRAVTPPYSGRALALGRELAAYVIAADLIDLRAMDPAFDASFRAAISSLLTAPTVDGPGNLVECHESRPNNWGTHCGASRAAVAAYLRDRGQLDRVAQVFRAWLGDRSAPAAFAFGDPSWQCDAARPVGVNPRGCTKEGHSIDGVLPDDQRRSGSFRWPPPRENYVYEALQGALVQAVILSRAGYGDVFSWGDAALLRAFEWLYTQADFPARGDDTWEVPLVNAFYGTAFPVAAPVSPGKNMGWTDFTHGR